MKNISVNNRYLQMLIFLFVAYASFAQSNTNLENRYRLAKTYEGGGKLEKAKDIYSELEKVQPWNSKYVQSLNEMYMRLKEFDESINLLEDKIANYSGDINYYGLLGSTYYVIGNKEKAGEIWNKACSLNPDSYMPYKIMANFAIQNRAFEQGISLLKQGQKIAKDPLIFSYDLANIYSATMNYKEAINEFSNILLKQPNQLEQIKSRIARFIQTENATKGAIEATEKFLIEHESEAVEMLLIFLYAQSDNYDKALLLTEKIDKKGNLIYNFAREALFDKKFSAASKAFKMIIEKYPTSPVAPSAEIGYARTLNTKLEDEKRNESGEWMPISFPDTNNSSEFIKVVEAYQNIINKYDGMEISVEARYRKGKIFTDHLIDDKKAEKYFGEILSFTSISEYSGLANYELGLIELRRNQIERAASNFHNVLANRRVSAEIKSNAKLMLGKIEFWSGNFEDSISRLAQITEKLSDNNTNDAIELGLIIKTMRSDSLNLRKFAEADFFINIREYTKAADILSELKESANSLFLKNLAEYYSSSVLLSEGKIEEALNGFKALSEKRMLNMFQDKSLFLMGNIYHKVLNDKENALVSYENLLDNFPNSLYFDESRRNLSLINK